MKPYLINRGGYTVNGRRTWRWRYGGRFLGRLSGGRRRVTARWPIALAWRERCDDGGGPYPPPDQDIWSIVYWRRRRRPAGHQSSRFVAADDGSRRQQHLAAQTRPFRSASGITRWWDRPHDQERVWA